MSDPILIVGAGISGATLARTLAEAGMAVHVIDERDHLAGNCHTGADAETGVMVHRYGPHILHTDDDRVWNFLARFAEIMPYRHRVFAVAQGQAYRLPLNLHTLAQVFGQPFTPQSAQAHVERLSEGPPDALDFEGRALHLMGRRLYELFFQGYTAKQWGCSPTEIPAAILKRLPIRFSYDDNYFHHVRQGMPKDGYTALIEKMLLHPRIQISLSCRFEDFADQPRRHLFYTGPIDRFFDFKLGRLSYRTLNFEHRYGASDVQGAPVINYCDANVAHTRITEHRHFAPWAPTPERSIISIETSREATADDVPFYPVHRGGDLKRLEEYQSMTATEPGVTFLGRLGTYRYLDMDQACGEALDCAQAYLAEFSDDS
ncbi:MAG: FAD-dependent oxidoreductase [Pseudomonadota bacterium]